MCTAEILDIFQTFVKTLDKGKTNPFYDQDQSYFWFFVASRRS